MSRTENFIRRVGAALFPTRPLGLFLAAFTGLMLGLGYYTWTYAEGGSYFSNDPRACANCHIMREYFDSWQKSPHHSYAACNDCHTPHSFISKYAAKAENGLRHSWKFTFQTFQDPLRITSMNLENLQDNCVRCHQMVVAGILPEHRLSGDQLCMHCHENIGHGARF